MSAELELQQRVIDELAFDPTFNAAHIGVSVRGSIVTLSGHVESYYEKLMAERAARRVKGVTGIAQEMEVRLPSEKRIADDEIAQRVVKILDWSISIPPRSIRVKVEHGIVALDGNVEWEHQREAAEQYVRMLGGVKDVVNALAIHHRVNANDISETLLAAFERDAQLEARRITVSVDDGKVRLGGRVKSWREREEARRAAWSVTGVYDVDDHIEIDPV